MKIRKSKRVGLETIRSRQGYFFVAHWIVGLVLFIAVPIVNAVRYAFCDVSIEASGIETTFAGLKHFKTILIEDPNYLNNLRDSFGKFLYTLPIILALSVVFAVLLNQNFPGRTILRAVFFLPVIMAGTNLIGMMNTGSVVGSTAVVYSGAEYTYGSIIDYKTILSNLNLPQQLTSIFSDYLQRVFQLVFDSSVQIILFLAGLQSIPRSLYEASAIEGATKWEEFWFITIPMLRHIISLVMIYTMIEFFTTTNNPVIREAYNVLRSRQIYDLSSAMLSFYFMIALIIMGTIILFYNKFCMKRWE